MKADLRISIKDNGHVKNLKVLLYRVPFGSTRAAHHAHDAAQLPRANQFVPIGCTTRKAHKPAIVELVVACLAEASREGRSS